MTDEVAAAVSTRPPKRSSQPQLSVLRDQWRYHSFSGLANLPVALTPASAGVPQHSRPAKKKQKQPEKTGKKKMKKAASLKKSKLPMDKKFKVDSVSSVSSLSSDSDEEDSNEEEDDDDEEEEEEEECNRGGSDPRPFLPPPRPPARRFCVRDGCSNLSIDDPQWDGEYCSTECCLIHVCDVRQLFIAMSPSDQLS